jgi:8-amino-7-oxononanoate synthase
VIRLGKGEVLNFASNDYLGLAGDSRLADAAQTALARNGVGVGASRLVVGNHQLHADLEIALADWMGCSGARVFNTGYAANTGILTALLRAGDVVFSDELNHASIVDGCRLSRAEIVVYPHRDLDSLEASLDQHAGNRRLIVSESLFSMDGDIADVRRLSALAAQYKAAWMLDEAHAVGVLGPAGRGIAAQHGVVPDLMIGTLGKAFGSAGAFVATTEAVADLLWNQARPFVFSTGLPPSIAAASLTALEIIRGEEGDRRRSKLQENVSSLRSQAPRLLGVRESPIAPLLVGSDERVVQISQAWLEHGVFVQAIRPPTVPTGTARLRISLSSEHQLVDIARAAKLVSEIESA